MTYYIMVKMLLQYQSGYSMTLLVFIVFYHISNQVKCRHYSIFRKLLHYRVLQSPKKRKQTNVDCALSHRRQRQMLVDVIACSSVMVIWLRQCNIICANSVQYISYCYSEGVFLLYPQNLHWIWTLTFVICDICDVHDNSLTVRRDSFLKCIRWW